MLTPFRSCNGIAKHTHRRILFFVVVFRQLHSSTQRPPFLA